MAKKKTKAKAEECAQDVVKPHASAKGRWELPPYKVEAVFTAQELGQQVDWGVEQNKVPSQWEKTKGEDVKIGIVDTGCELQHPDLEGAIIASQDFTNSPAGAMDRAGHGTHCAGIIGARNNDKGTVGVAPEAQLIIGKGLDDFGSGTSRGLIRAIEFCASEGAEVISASWGSPYPDPNILAAIKELNDAGIFFICAAGNDGRDNSVNYPAKWRNGISVASVQRNGTLSPFSSRGPEVDIAAPGQDILSTYLLSKGGYAKLSGTSMATPFVAATVALAISVHKKLKKPKTPLKTVDDLRKELARTANDAGPQGHDPSYGWGLINVESLLTQEDLGSGVVLPPPVQGEITISAEGLKFNGVPGVLIFRPTH